MKSSIRSLLSRPWEIVWVINCIVGVLSAAVQHGHRILKCSQGPGSRVNGRVFEEDQPMPWPDWSDMSLAFIGSAGAAKSSRAEIFTALSITSSSCLGDTTNHEKEG